MELKDARIVLTGAGGGIGRPLAQQLAAAGARLLLIGRDDPCGPPDTKADGAFRRVDLLEPRAPARVSEAVQEVLGGVDVLINLAGANSFREFVAEDSQVTETIMRLNALAPMQLAQALLPGMLAQGQGRIVNVGSIFGSIGFAYFASYSASKFALRGFSEALRRELAGTGLGVTYVAPRATRTGFNADAVYRMAETVKMNVDEPADVARSIVAAIRAERDECYLGWPERLFVRLNALLPRLVDAGVRGQNRQAARFARQSGPV